MSPGQLFHETCLQLEVLLPLDIPQLNHSIHEIMWYHTNQQQHAWREHHLFQS